VARSFSGCLVPGIEAALVSEIYRLSGLSLADNESPCESPNLPLWLILEIGVGELLAVGVLHDEAFRILFDGPEWREAQGQSVYGPVLRFCP
jgi:hypothetical protein